MIRGGQLLQGPTETVTTVGGSVCMTMCVSGHSLEWGWKCCVVWRVALESKEARAWCSYGTDKQRPGSTPIQCLRNLPVHA